MTKPPLPPAPKGFKLIAVLCIAFSSCTGVFAATETMNLMRLEEVRAAQFQDPKKADTPASHEALDAHMRQLEAMRGIRGVVLTLLAIVCAICFVAATRMLSPPVFPRESVRQLLTNALIGAAILRTIDGAQQAAIANQLRDKWVAALKEQLVGADPQLLAAADQFRHVVVPAHMAITFFAVTALVLFFSYFRSEPVRTYVEQTDAQLH